MKVEKWICENGEKEIHFYKKKDNSIYVFGVNPRFVSDKLTKKILKMIKKENR
jgi:hypothetical protein